MSIKDEYADKFFNGKTVGVFPGEASLALVSRIESAGGNVFQLPRAARRLLEVSGHLKTVAKELTSFDWLVFCDPWAVESFFEILGSPSTQMPEQTLVCSVGEASAAELRRFFVHSDITVQSPDSILKAITDYFGDAANPTLLIISGSQNPLVFFGREDVEIKITNLEVYRPQFPMPADAAKAKSLFIGGAIDAVVVSSTEDVMTLGSLLIWPAGAAISGLELYALNTESFHALYDLGFRSRLIRSS